MPNARPMRESRASGVLCDLVVIEPHELVYVEYNSNGEGKGVEMAGGSGAASADGWLDWSGLPKAQGRPDAELSPGN